ncbi:hypothetical protein PMAYCL1PPCAC_20033, partial [Pristionchus mayeri]
RNLDKLMLKNKYTEFISRESANSLMEQLPRIGKNVWFLSTCSSLTDKADYEQNDHICRGIAISCCNKWTLLSSFWSSHRSISSIEQLLVYTKMETSQNLSAIEQIPHELVWMI